MDNVIKNATLVVLPGRQKSGVKIKLLNSLAKAKPVLATPETLNGSGLENILPRFETQKN